MQACVHARSAADHGTRWRGSPTHKLEPWHAAGPLGPLQLHLELMTKQGLAGVPLAVLPRSLMHASTCPAGRLVVVPLCHCHSTPAVRAGRKGRGISD